MRTKIKITEAQLNRLRSNLNEVNVRSTIIKRMVEDLDLNYEPIEKFVREGGDYSEKAMFRVKADDEVISPKSLFEYLKYKYKLGEDFTKQVIRDWVSGTISNDFNLTKNIPMK